jgi:alpha-glucosidase
MNKTHLLLAALAGIALSASAQPVHTLRSPDGKIQVSIEMPAPGSAEKPRWSATFHKEPILSRCGLGLETADSGELLAGARVVNKRTRSVDDRIPVLFGKADHANDSFREIRFTLENPGHRRFDVLFRCYDDAVALRYELPSDSSQSSVTIKNETTSFHFEGNPTAYV